MKVSNWVRNILTFFKKVGYGIGKILSPVGRLIFRAAKGFWELLCRNKSFARFAYVTFPPMRDKAWGFIKKNKLKFIIPAIVCVVLASVMLMSDMKNTDDGEYERYGDDSADFGMVLQNYNTFDHSEKTHIAVRLSWTNGAVDLENGVATARIKANVYPVNLENREIEWVTTDETIATIDENGKIAATAPGKVRIIARLKNYDKSAKAKLTIRQPVTGIIIPTSTVTMELGGGARYLNPRIFPENASDKNVKWQSKDSKIATVDQNGTVKPVRAGMTEITVTTEDGNFEARCFVTVVNPTVDIEKITLQNGNDMNLAVGDSINAVVTVSPQNAKNKTLRWTSDNENVAAVSQTGRIRAVGEGQAYITVSSVNGKKHTFLVNVGASDRGDPFNLGGEEEENESYVSDGTVTYSSYNMTFPQVVRIQMAQNPPPKIWTNNGVVYASEAETAEYMNPNNYYAGAYKYQFLDLSKTSGVTADTLNAFLSDKGILRGKGQAFIDAANTYHVNEVYLVAHACLESGNGTSQLATGVEVNGETVYNLFGIAAYDSGALEGGSQKAYREGWTTVDAAIMGGAKWISTYYVNSSDTRQNTLYKMLWNPERPGYHQYATDVGWAVKQAVSMNSIFERMSGAVYSYDIPVYSGMIPPTISQ